MHFIRQCFGGQAYSVFAAMVVNNTACCFRCGFKWNFHEAAQVQVRNVWNIRVQVLLVKKHSPLLQTINCACFFKSAFQHVVLGSQFLPIGIIPPRRISHINEQSEARYIPVTKRSSSNLMSVLYNILSSLSRSSHECSLFKTRTQFFTVLQ